jgi:F-type H+-transporting ATPase subunit epsilon
MRFELVSPSKVFFEGTVEEINAPGIEGDFGVLPGHTPFLTFLNIGELIYKVNGNEKYVAIDGGIIEVLPTRVIAIVDDAYHAEDINLKEAEDLKVNSEQRLRELNEDDKEYAAEKAKLSKALNLIKVAGRIK